MRPSRVISLACSASAAQVPTGRPMIDSVRAICRCLAPRTTDRQRGSARTVAPVGPPRFVSKPGTAVRPEPAEPRMRHRLPRSSRRSGRRFEAAARGVGASARRQHAGWGPPPGPRTSVSTSEPGRKNSSLFFVPPTTHAVRNRTGEAITPGAKIEHYARLRRRGGEVVQHGDLFDDARRSPSHQPTA